MSTGKERDTESGLDYFGARYYASSMGRWMSPDWADKPEAVPYSSLDNPQSLNLYGYVGNNPLSRVDADGHQQCSCGQLVPPPQQLMDAAQGALDDLVTLGKKVMNALPTVTLTTVSTAGIGQIVLNAKDSAPTAAPKTAEPPQLAKGKEAHKTEEIRPGEKAEVPTPSGKGRMDRYNPDTDHIREIKPNNPRGEQAGNRQLEKYKTEMEEATGRPHTTELTKYPTSNPKTPQ